MNYIKHLNGVMFQIFEDNRLHPTHISLYMALFQFWNLRRFKNPVSICRADTMQHAKIFSKTTYHKCLKDLERFGYIKYKPSHNPYRGSEVFLIKFDEKLGQQDKNTVSKNGQPLDQGQPINGQAVDQSVPKIGQVLYQGRSKVGQALVPYINSINNNKLYKHKESKQATRPKIEQVKNFFKKEGCEKRQAEKFFNHYESKGWVVGKDPIVNWRAAAKKWIINSEERKDHEEKQNRAHDQNWDNLNVNNDKRYDHPL